MSKLNKFIFPLILALVTGAAQARADVTLPQNFNFDGVLQDNNGVPIATSQTVDFKIFDPSGSNCLLYEETQTVSPDAQGNFSLQVGAGTRGGGDPGLTWAQIFQNNALVRPSGTGCSAGYTPAAGDERSMVVTVGSTVLSPAFAMTAVPMATVAQTLQGLPTSQFLQVGGATTPNLTQIGLAAMFTGTAYTNLQSVMSGEFAPSSTTGGVQLPTYSTSPSSPAAGNIWYNSTNGTISYYNGTSAVALSAGVSAGAGLSSSGNTISLPNVGTAGTYTKVTTDAQGIVTSGTQITGSDIGPGGTISGTTTINVTGNITGLNLTGNMANVNSVLLNQGGYAVTLAPPTGLSGNYTLNLPPNAGIMNQFLTTNGTGNLSWSSIPAGALPQTYLTTGSPGLILGTMDTNPLTVETNGITAMTVSPTGSVGIGTTVPMGILAVNSNNTANPQLTGGFDPAIVHRVQAGTIAMDMGVSGAWSAGWIQTRDAAIDGNVAYLSLNPYGGAVQIGLNTPGSSTYELSVLQNGTTNGMLVKGTGAGDVLDLQNSGGTDLDVFTNSGSVGIGDANPTSALDVNGAMTLRGMAAPATTSAGQGRLYFDSTSNQLLVSQNGGAYAPVATTSGAQAFSSNITMSGGGTGLAVTNNETVGGAFSVTGPATFTGASSFAGGESMSSSGLAMGAQSITGVGANVTGNGPLAVAAGGTNQSLTLSGSGSGSVVLTPNVGIGTTTPAAALDVYGNIDIRGLNALTFPTTDTSPGGSIAIGNGALNKESSLASTAFLNTAIGYQTMASVSMNTQATDDTAIGAKALSANTTGGSNTAIGALAMVANTTGGSNAAVGSGAMFSATSASNSVAVGSSALYNATTGMGNIGVGQGTGNTLATGNYNILIGSNLGGGADVPSASTSNFLNLGNVIFATNMTGSVNSPAGNVGIGTSAPAVTLHVNGTDSIRIPSGTTAQRPTAPANGDLRYNTTTSSYENYNNGTWAAFSPPGGMQTFTSSGPFIVPLGVIKVKVTVIGGGGGGYTTSFAGGPGAGGTAVLAVTPGTLTVTVGAGGGVVSAGGASSVTGEGITISALGGAAGTSTATGTAGTFSSTGDSGHIPLPGAVVLYGYGTGGAAAAAGQAGFVIIEY